MRTVHCSSRLLGGGAVLSACRGGVCPGDGWQAPPCGQNDRCLWKYYLPTTTLRMVTMRLRLRFIYHNWEICVGFSVIVNTYIEPHTTGSDSVQRAHPHEQTDRCKNITLPQTSFAGGKNRNRTVTGSLLEEWQWRVELCRSPQRKAENH